MFSWLFVLTVCSHSQKTQFQNIKVIKSFFFIYFLPLLELLKLQISLGKRQLPPRCLRRLARSRDVSKRGRSRAFFSLGDLHDRSSVAFTPARLWLVTTFKELLLSELNWASLQHSSFISKSFTRQRTLVGFLRVEIWKPKNNSRMFVHVNT